MATKSKLKLKIYLSVLLFPMGMVGLLFTSTMLAFPLQAQNSVAL
jgi:hypothetical protein